MNFFHAYSQYSDLTTIRNTVRPQLDSDRFNTAHDFFILIQTATVLYILAI